MSDEQTIQLSEALIAQLIQTIAGHDPRAGEDSVLGLQYLAAVIGYVAGAYPGSAQDRQALLDHLAAFARQVADDRAASQQQAAAQPEAPKGHSEPTDDPAVGIWKPE
jgi:hypothetical protein